jgi:hypothetical protein
MENLLNVIANSSCAIITLQQGTIEELIEKLNALATAKGQPKVVAKLLCDRSFTGQDSTKPTYTLTFDIPAQLTTNPTTNV